jgi:hypothetical protein
MSVYYVIGIRVLCPKDKAKFKFEDYEYIKGSDDYLNDSINDKISDYFNSSGLAGNLWTPKNYIKWNPRYFDIELIYDYDKIKDKIQNTVDGIKRILIETIQGATTTIAEYPNPPLYEFIKSESSDTVNTFTGAQDGGGWSIVVHLSSPDSPPQLTATQSAPPVGNTQSGPEITPQETPTSLPEDPPVEDTPPQETPPDSSLTSPPPTEEQEQATSQDPEQNTPTNTDEQDSGREERTGETPNENEKKPEDVEKTKGIKNVFPNQKTAQTIKFDLPPDEAYQKEFVESFGNLPFLWYNAYQIEYNNIKNLELSYVDNIPHINVTFRDSLGKMKDEGMPLDDSRISFFLNPRTKLLKPIHLDFKIIDFSENKGIYQIQGFLDVKDLYLKKFKSYPKLTSFGLYKQISKDLGLGFNSNIDDTDDKMTWINTGHKLF